MKRFLKAFVSPGLLVVPMVLLAIWAILAPSVDPNSAGGWLVVAVVVGTAAFIFFLPTTIAGLHDAPSYIGILIVNTLGGMFIIGWIATLIWAFVDRQTAPVIVQNIYQGQSPDTSSAEAQPPAQ